MHEYLGGDRNSPTNTLPLPMHYGPNRGSMCSFLFTQHRQLVPFPTSHTSHQARDQPDLLQGGYIVQLVNHITHPAMQASY